MPPIESWAQRLRQYATWAGLTREDLFADDEMRRPLTFHDLRHSGITWRALRGDDPMKIMRAAGHADLRTSQRYVNEAQTFEDRSTFGTMFPAVGLERLLGFGLSSGFHRNSFPQVQDNTLELGRPQGDSNPC